MGGKSLVLTIVRRYLMGHNRQLKAEVLEVDTCLLKLRDLNSSTSVMVAFLCRHSAKLNILYPCSSLASSFNFL